MKHLLLPLILILSLCGCAGGWTEDDKKKLKADCVSEAKKQISEAQTEQYCNCFVEQMLKAYPVFNDAMEHYQADTIEKLKAHCRQEIGLP